MLIRRIQAIVNIQSYKFGFGLDDNGKTYASADMKLEGRLSEKPEGNWLGLESKVQVSTNIDVEFREGREDWNRFGDKKYMGYIQSFQPSDRTGATISGERSVNIRIALPYDMFSNVRSFGERDIIFDATNDMVIKADEREEMDHIVAWVRWVYFGERLWWHKEGSKTSS